MVNETLSITIPQGLPDGSRMRLRGQGRPGVGGGASGDLLLEVGVEPHSVYRREGDTLAVNLPISLSEALEGAKVDLPTPWGVISLRLPAGTSFWQKASCCRNGSSACEWFKGRSDCRSSDCATRDG